MNGGPAHELTEAFSLSVGVETQQEVDEISDALIEGGGEQGPAAGSSTPSASPGRSSRRRSVELLGDPDREKAGRAQAAMMQMMRLDIQGLQDAFDGK